MDEQQRKQMTEKLATDAGFLEEIAARPDLGEVEVQRLRMIAQFLKPAEVENDQAMGLNRWSMRDWARRPRQTGMEQENERVVLALINLFAGLDIPFYILDPVTQQKTGREYSSQERLGMLRTKIGQWIADKSAADLRAADANKLLGDYEIALRAAISELRENPHYEQAVGRAKVILENVVHDPTSSVRISGPDDRGVRRVTLDSREVMLRLCMQRIVHDLAPNEQICKRCLGLGIFKMSSSYGIGDQKPGEDAFPFFHQWLSSCTDCYMGKVKVCGHCNRDLPRSRTQCECPAAQSERFVADDEKEQARRKLLKRISLDDYKEPMLWCDECDSFVDVDAVEDHMEGCYDDSDHRPRVVNAVFFACEPTVPLSKPDAEDVIESLQNQATEEASPEDGEDVLDFSKEAASELDELLEEWAKKHVTPRTMYYADMNLIVEVPRGKPDTTDGLLDVQSDVAGGDDASGSA